MANIKPLKPHELFQRCNPEQFSFETTDDLEDLDEIIGQPRAVEAVRFGTSIEQKGYNIFALGPPGSGKHSMLRQFFIQKAVTAPVPSDWCYVYNFEQDHKPRAIQLPPGKGSEFKQDMELLVEELRTSLSTAFESDEYRSRRQLLEEELQEQQEKSLEEIQERAQQSDLSLLRTPSGLVFAPVRDGEVLPPEEFQKLPTEERERLEKSVVNLQEELRKVLQRVPTWKRELQKNVRDLNREITDIAIGDLMEELRQKYTEFPPIVEHLNAVQKDVKENAQEFISQDESPEEDLENPLANLMTRVRQRPSIVSRYQVNLLVDHQASEGAPVIYEDNPTYLNLVGRVEHIAQMGALITNFMQIKCGALLQANGGYLILDARKILTEPYAYEALKRSLKSRQVRIESPGQMLSLVSTISLDPEPIPLDVKVALLGERMVYYLLTQQDPEFSELFKVQADFEDLMARSPETQKLYARLIATLAHKDGLKPFSRGAVACLIDRSARIVGDSEKLSAQIEEISSLMREADYWAGESGNNVVNTKDIKNAIDAQSYRANRLQERLRENILRETILIATKGSQVGQVNGLSVLQLGNYSFGSPSRITASIRMGKGEVVNIEREVDMSGPIHSKGVLILSGFLGARYASNQPLSLSASLVFEQSYSGVEGDSASSTELYALLSAIANVPIKQSLAVTGSVNQHGQVQAIGGVNEKIEGFFDLCKERGLTGDQGVLIPNSNVKHLMLRQDVIEAVETGQFYIYPIETIDQGIEVLTGIPAGFPDDKGIYPEDTVNGMVHARLTELVEKRREFSKETREGEP